jgi:hypothetical protein
MAGNASTDAVDLVRRLHNIPQESVLLVETARSFGHLIPIATSADSGARAIVIACALADGSDQPVPNVRWLCDQLTQYPSDYSVLTVRAGEEAVEVVTRPGFDGEITWLRTELP